MCAGCGGSITRLVTKVLGRGLSQLPGRLHVCCCFMYSQLCFANNALISTFAGTASIMSGIAAGAKALGLQDFHVLGMAGDGGTADIGLQALSGARDRRDRVI